MIWKYGLVGWLFVLAWWAVKWLAWWVSWPWFFDWDAEYNEKLAPLSLMCVLPAAVVLLGSRGAVALSIAGFLVMPMASLIAFVVFNLVMAGLCAIWLLLCWLLKPPAGMFAWWK